MQALPSVLFTDSQVSNLHCLGAPELLLPSRLPLLAHMLPFPHIHAFLLQLCLPQVTHFYKYSDIDIDNDHIVCISHICTIVYLSSGYKFLIPIPGDCNAELCTRTYEIYLPPCIVHTNSILCARDSLYMSDQLHA